MPKQKTKKSLLNRFKITKTGKILRRRAFTGHLKTKKSRGRVRGLKKSVLVNPIFAKKIKKAMGK